MLKLCRFIYNLFHLCSYSKNSSINGKYKFHANAPRIEYQPTPYQYSLLSISIEILTLPSAAKITEPLPVHGMPSAQQWRASVSNVIRLVPAAQRYRSGAVELCGQFVMAEAAWCLVSNKIYVKIVKLCLNKYLHNF